MANNCLKEVPKIAVVMSTYNGERYVKEQIDSIVNQTDVSVDLYIRDDGSTDNTLSILKQYNNYPNIIIKSGENIGLAKSFFECLFSINGDYDFFAFSDQDDVWENDKLIAAVQCLNASKKCLYFSNQTCVDAELNNPRIRFNQVVPCNCFSILTSNSASGCTMVFTKKLYNLMKEKKRRPSDLLLEKRIHDVWVAMVASVTYGVIYDKESHMLYRQHGDNVVGADKDSVYKKISKYIDKILKTTKRCGRSTLAKEIISKYSDFIPKDSFLYNCSDYHSLKSKTSLIKGSKVFRKYTGEKLLPFSIKVFCNYF